MDGFQFYNLRSRHDEGPFSKASPWTNNTGNGIVCWILRDYYNMDKGPFRHIERNRRRVWERVGRFLISLVCLLYLPAHDSFINYRGDGIYTDL